MFTSRCTTPLACALAQPRRNFESGDHRRRDFSFLAFSAATPHASARTDDHMTALTHLHTVRPRHAGEHRLAGSWCAPLGAMGTGAQWSVDAARSMCGSRMSQPSDRKQPSIEMQFEVTFRKTGEFGYGSLDAGRSGAGSGFRGDAP